LGTLSNATELDLLTDTDKHDVTQILDNNHVFAIKRTKLDDGKIIQTYTDITESYYYAQTLKENEKWLRTITDNVPAMIAYIDNHRTFRFVNKVYNNWYAKNLNSLVNTVLNDSLDFPNYGLLAPYINRALDGETVSFESKEQDAYGNDVYLLKSYVPNIRHDHTVDGFFVLITDITDRINAAQALQDAYDELEDRVELRTHELSKANESKSKFLAAVSHDLLQPLNAAQLFINSLLSAEDKRPDLLQSMQSSLFDLENLIVTLVDISKLDAGVVRADKTIFPLDRLLRNIASDYERISVEQGIAFTYVPTQLSVHSDSVLLARILRNYLSNAIRHTAGGKVLLGTRRQGDCINIEVWDNGDGIAKDDLGIIFQEFKRLKRSPRAHQSLGLGLAIVDKMAKVLEHAIDVRSELGKGSCFSVRLPVVKTVDEAVKDNDLHQPVTMQAQQQTIWVVDNDEAICLGMHSLLSDWGFAVQTATSTEQLAEQLSIAGSPCDLLIVDYHLDNENGFDVVRKINRMRAKRVPAIMITANYSPELQQLTKQQHITLLNKPIKPLKLKMSMQLLLNQTATI
jgi:PAS domain S-box-containing protein